MRTGLLPLTYDECRARFRHTTGRSGRPIVARSIDATGPHGQDLTIDHTWIGNDRPRRVLVTMSGVHGVEGFVGSAMQCELIERLSTPSGVEALADDMAVVLVHAVNPWGMAWWRRQNESNVDLNRNWARDRIAPPADVGYAELHPLLCPDGDQPPDAERFLDAIGRHVSERGLPWVRTAVSAGQYTHPDGLYFGGDELEASTRIVAEIAAERLADAESVFTVDLHTGHGAYGSPTILCDHPTGSPKHDWLRRWFEPSLIEVTVDNPDATMATKVGQIGHGLADLVPRAEYRSVTLEIGTRSDTTMILAERAEHWVHRHGERGRRGHDEIVWHHRTCSTPEDPAWVSAALDHGRSVLEAALRAVAADHP